jgi:hypothetical protein
MSLTTAEKMKAEEGVRTARRNSQETAKTPFVFLSLFLLI